MSAYGTSDPMRIISSILPSGRKAHRNMPIMASDDRTALVPGIQPSSPVHLVVNGWTKSPLIAVSRAVIGRPLIFEAI